jgi:hypothetical protein
MELIPKALVVGVFTIVPPGNASPATPETLNRIWAEVAPQHDYRQLQLAADGSAAQFFGATPDDGATIQLPLLQVRSSIRLDAATAADGAQLVLKSMAQHLGVAQFFNLGIKYTFHVPVRDNDARAFVLRRLLGQTPEKLAGLQRGGSLWAGVKYGVEDADGSLSVVVIEPLHADPENRNLYLDLDVQHPRPVTLDEVQERGRDAVRFATSAVKEYLEDAEAGL